ncbi:MAG: glycosyltransferase [Rhodobacter sp.]|nr:glycosyltransferase [Paracoccaceae bacterium]MCC0076756.1 glycosyltransferase [Rhodobacter sp.]
MSTPPPTAPRVGIVIRTKDRPLFVPRALATVLAQTCTAWRVALVNDGGDAKALTAAIRAAGLQAPFDDGRMMRIDLPASIGRSDAFNRGVAALETEFVCCLDDDDSWDPAFLDSLLTLVDETQPLAPDLGGAAALVTAVREDIVTRGGQDTLVRLGEDQLPNSFRRTDFFLDPIAYATYRHDLYPVQWMLNRKAVQAVGGFPSAFNVMEDRAFMTRFLQRNRLAILDKPLAFHHRRVRRKGDTGRSVAMNTLDNPSYDWRLYSDLARIEVATPRDLAADAPLTAAAATDLVRAAAATVVKELNDETSALWHKINGESMALNARIEALEARLGAVDPMQPCEADPKSRVWSLWDSVGDLDIGYPLSSTAPFLERMRLSMAEDQQGLYLHASPAQRRLVLQIPQTRDFTALELSLAGLADAGGGLRCEVILGSQTGFLFQSALSLFVRDRLGRRSHVFDEPHVHSCPPGGTVRIDRMFLAPALDRCDAPKLSIILPRQAHDFRLSCHDLVVSRT